MPEMDDRPKSENLNRTLRVVGRGRTAMAIAGVGTPGGVARKLAENVAMPHIDRGAAAAARKFAARKEAPPAPEEKLAGWSFWAVVMVAVLKDMLDVFINLTVFFAIAAIFTGLALSFIILFYLYLSGVEADTRKVVTVAISIAVEMIPFLSALPVTTLSLFVIRWFERSDYAKKLLQHTSGLKDASTPPRAAPSPA